MIIYKINYRSLAVNFVLINSIILIYYILNFYFKSDINLPYTARAAFFINIMLSINSFYRSRIVCIDDDHIIIKYVFKRKSIIYFNRIVSLQETYHGFYGNLDS